MIVQETLIENLQLFVLWLLELLSLDFCHTWWGVYHNLLHNIWLFSDILSSLIVSYLYKVFCSCACVSMLSCQTDNCINLVYKQPVCLTRVADTGTLCLIYASVSSCHWFKILPCSINPARCRFYPASVLSVVFQLLIERLRENLLKNNLWGFEFSFWTWYLFSIMCSFVLLVLFI